MEITVLTGNYEDTKENNTIIFKQCISCHKTLRWNPVKKIFKKRNYSYN